MALNVPNVGESAILAMIVNKTAPQNLVLKLFVNNITPSDTDTHLTYTEADTGTFPGYAAKVLTGATWDVSGDTVSYPQQSFVCDSSSATADVYGYYVVQQTSGILMWAERDAAAPFPVRNLDDTVRVTPTLTAN